MTVFRVTTHRLLYVEADNEWDAKCKARADEHSVGVNVRAEAIAEENANRWTYTRNGVTQTIREHLKEAGR